MRTAEHVYSEYNIMPSLQLHQLRVAAVGKVVCDNFTKPIDTRNVILACLFHDMGNIIKSDLSHFPDFLEPEGREYWQGVKDAFVEKYGSDHHAANVAIAREIDLPQSVYNLLDGIGFSKLNTILLDASDEQKVCEYADLRVGPRGILPMEERLIEGRDRYKQTNKKRPHYDSEESFRKLVDSAKKLEAQVLANTSLSADDLTDAAIRDSVEELRNYSVA